MLKQMYSILQEEDKMSTFLFDFIFLQSNKGLKKIMLWGRIN